MTACIAAGIGGDMVLVFLLIKYPVIVIIAKKLMLYGQSGAFVTGGGGNIVVTASVPGDADIRSLLAVIVLSLIHILLKIAIAHRIPYAAACSAANPVSYTHLDVYKRQVLRSR